MRWSLSLGRVGNIRTIFNNRLVIGPDWPWFLLSFSLIAICTIVYVAYTNILPVACLLTGLLALTSLLLLCMCSMSSPGVCARNTELDADESPATQPRWWRVACVRSDGSVHYAPMQQKWCASCRNYRPCRAVHCRYCDVCVHRRDHHCPWTGICIGGGNYCYYYLLLWSLLLFLVSGFVGGVMSLVRRVAMAREQDDMLMADAVYHGIGATYCLELLLIVFSLAWLMLVLSLTIYHTYLITQNLTSNDEAKHLTENIFRHDSVLSNIRDALCFSERRTDWFAEDTCSYEESGGTVERARPRASRIANAEDVLLVTPTAS